MRRPLRLLAGAATLFMAATASQGTAQIVPYVPPCAVWCAAEALIECVPNHPDDAYYCQVYWWGCVSSACN
jgi:hypothetical protein